MPAENDVYATSGAANALLARVYLQKGDYAKARDAASAVIGSDTYSLLTNYADVFNQDNNTPEDIFATQITSQDRFSSMTEFFSVPEYGGRDGDIDILPAIWTFILQVMREKTSSSLEKAPCSTGKWNNQYGGD